MQLEARCRYEAAQYPFLGLVRDIAQLRGYSTELKRKDHGDVVLTATKSRYNVLINENYAKRGLSVRRGTLEKPNEADPLISLKILEKLYGIDGSGMCFSPEGLAEEMRDEGFTFQTQDIRDFKDEALLKLATDSGILPCLP